MSDWQLRKSFNQLHIKEDVMMNRNEKWEHERNLDEIVDRFSELIANILLMSVKQVNDQYVPLKKRLELDPEDISF
jgi:hypothetical protein